METMRTRYHLSLMAFLLFLAILLLGLVDVRRGFLFSGYFKVGAPSVLLNLNQLQVPFIISGILGMWLAYRYIRRLEANPEYYGTGLQTPARVVAVIIGLLFVVDLFIYRGVPALRTLASGKMAAGPGTLGLGWALPVSSLPSGLQPLGEGVSYILVVWHATLLGILLGGLFLAAGTSMGMIRKGSGFGSHLAGAALGLTQPFCSCCAAPVGFAMYRKGASLGPVLAFTVTSPMLNITSLILATALLPLQFALLRILAGVLVGVFVTYIVSALARRWEGGSEASPGRMSRWAAGVAGWYGRLLNLESISPADTVPSPGSLISTWFSTAWKLAKVMVPVIIIGSLVASYIVRVAPGAANTPAGVVATSAFATLLMAPTWTEIPLAARLINDGFTGTAATVLIALPAVSIPCLTIIAGAVRSLRVAVVLGLSVFAVAAVAGLLFL